MTGNSQPGVFISQQDIQPGHGHVVWYVRVPVCLTGPAILDIHHDSAARVVQKLGHDVSWQSSAYMVSKTSLAVVKTLLITTNSTNANQHGLTDVDTIGCSSPRYRRGM